MCTLFDVTEVVVRILLLSRSPLFQRHARFLIVLGSPWSNVGGVLKVFFGKRYERCCDIHRACQEEDRLCSEKTRTYFLWFWRLNSSFIVWKTALFRAKTCVIRGLKRLCSPRMPAFVLTESIADIPRACTLRQPYRFSALLGQDPYHIGGMSALALGDDRRFCGSASEQCQQSCGFCSARAPINEKV